MTHITHYQLVRVPVGRRRSGKQQYEYLIYEAVSIKRNNRFELVALNTVPECGGETSRDRAWADYISMEPMAKLFREYDYDFVKDKLDYNGRFFPEDLYDDDFYIDDDDKVIDITQYFKKNR